MLRKTNFGVQTRKEWATTKVGEEPIENIELSTGAPQTDDLAGDELQPQLFGTNVSKEAKNLSCYDNQYYMDLRNCRFLKPHLPPTSLTLAKVVE
jgi:inorganic triphosphatase YgiF